jgi:hypothetical protein
MILHVALNVLHSLKLEHRGNFLCYLHFFILDASLFKLSVSPSKSLPPFAIRPLHKRSNLESTLEDFPCLSNLFATSAVAWLRLSYTKLAIITFVQLVATA